MSILIEDFLNRYFGSTLLKEPLENIGLSVGGTKKERINRIVENWTTHHRDWYDLLSFLDWEKLSKICDDFGITYSDYNTDDTLCKKIEDERILDFRRKRFQTKTLFSKDLSKNETQKIKSNPYVIYPIIGWMVIGIIFAILNFSGMFIENHEEEIDISKKYQVTYESWKDDYTLEGLYMGMSLSGKIILQSTQFSAQNQINVHVELSPDEGSNIKNMMMLDSIPPPFYVYFIGAQHVDIENDRPLADILLTRSADRTKLIGDGSIIYSKGDVHEIYVLDYSETTLKQDLLTVNDAPGAVILFPVNEKTLNPNGYVDEAKNQLTIPTRVELTSTTEPYLIEIKQSDAQSLLGSDKMDAGTIWITFAFAPFAIISALKYFLTNKL